ncbi:DUF6886 family protein [Paenibacillus sp.]|uniref:DUF6886 family protein n=1 Tax=Paenibacillus sp. TaxID=58172 RepID=UPI002810FBDC|nr:DUF6886 family protein [Paenibacillus sp.]
MLLYHFSEDPDIQTFVPRRAERGDASSEVVWAIDEQHAVNYFFPRECPRIIYRKSETMSDEDRERFFSDTTADTVIVTENGWWDRMNETVLYRYTFKAANFELYDDIAGYYIAKTTVEPIDVEPVGNLVKQIMRWGAELRFTPSLVPLREKILSSTIDDFSMIRLRNAKGMPESASPASG